jgi:hypothetical protein
LDKPEEKIFTPKDTKYTKESLYVLRVYHSALGGGMKKNPCTKTKDGTTRYTKRSMALAKPISLRLAASSREPE